MDAKTLIKIMKDQIQASKNEQLSSFTIEQIEQWVNSLESETESQGQEYSPIKIEEYKLTHQSKLEGYKAQNQMNIEMFRSVIQYGQASLKSAILINGGAAVALLAFIGKIWSDEKSKIVINELSYSLTLFVFGTLAVAVATGITYIAQSLFNEGKIKIAHCVNGLIISLVIGSYIIFSLGVFSTYVIFTTQ